MLGRSVAGCECEMETAIDDLVSGIGTLDVAGAGAGAAAATGGGFLVVLNGHVYSRCYIPSGICLGEIIGRPEYIFDIGHSDYMIVCDELVLDLSGLVHPRSPLCYVHETNESPNPANAYIVVATNQNTGETRFFLHTAVPIQAGDEIVYSAWDTRC